MTYAWIIAGAVVGAPLRYFLQLRVQQFSGWQFPLGTMLVNVTGCFVIGLLATLAEERGLSREVRLLLITGFLGSYTTFSAFGWDSFAYSRDGDILRAGANIMLSVGFGVAATWLGSVTARAT